MAAGEVAAAVRICRLGALLAALVLATSCAPAGLRRSVPLQGAPSAPRADEGAEVANALQTRIVDVRGDCGGVTRPAFLCTGILLRGTSPQPDREVWDPKDADIADGGTSFSFLRADIASGRLAYGYKSGFIFFPIMTMPPGMEDIEILCAFPLDAHSNDREAPGCGPHKNYPDTSGPCQSQSPPITTAAAWLNHFRQVKTVPQQQHQCGFDVRDSTPATSAIFRAFIEAEALLGAEAFAKQNELVLAAWKPGLAATLPIEAFFYLPGQAGALDEARHAQRAMYETTRGRYIPIVSLDLPERQGEPPRIGFDEVDQAIHLPTYDGPSTLLLMQARYASQQPNCGGSPDIAAFRCSGLIIRGTNASAEQPYHFWNPSPTDEKDGGVSFSFLRSDTKFKRFAYDYSHGFVLFPPDLTPAWMRSGIITFPCAFPIEGSTNTRTSPCGRHANYSDSGPCQLQGIVTAQAYYEHYAPRAPGQAAHQHQCAILLDSADSHARMFAAFPAAQALIGQEAFDVPNEIVADTWPQDRGNLPVEALVYVPGMAGALDASRFEQRDLFMTTGQVAPIMRLIFPATRDEQALLEYHPEDGSPDVPLPWVTRRDTRISEPPTPAH